MQTMNAKEMYAEAWMYYLSGNFTMRQIAEALEIPYHTLTTYAGRNKWARKRADIHKRAGKGLKDSLQARIEQARVEHLHGMMDQLEETAENIAMKEIGEADPDDPEGKRIVKVGDKLSLIEQQHRIATSVLKLDDVPKADPTREGFEFLMSLRALPLSNNSDANAGIIRSNNALPDSSSTHEIEVQAEVIEQDQQKNEDLIAMLRRNGYDAHDISHCTELPATPADIPPPPSMEPGLKPAPAKLTFK